jgi:hypothetical protein
VVALLVLVAVLGFGYAVSRATAMPAARGVTVSTRMEEARRLVARTGQESSFGRRPCEQPLDGSRGQARRHQPRSYVAHCNSGAALGLRHSGRS